MGRKKQLKELTIKDNFMFGAVMMDEGNCKGLLERVLQIPIDRVEISKEKSIVYHPEYKGVRLDVYVKDEKQTRYIVEMQVEKKPALGRRSRYYQIFICDFDPFGEGKYRYTLRMKCEESAEVKFVDGRTIVFLNTHGKNESEVPKELVTLLNYIREDVEGSEREFHDSYVERLQKFIREVKADREMEERFMIFEEMLKDERAEGRVEGCKETLLLYLQNLGTVSETICDKIQSQQELEVLKQWTKMAFQAKTVEEFEEKISL